MAFNEEWLRPGDRRLTAEEVMALPNGKMVTLMGADMHGEKQCQDGIIGNTKSGEKVFVPLMILNGILCHMEWISIRNYKDKAWVLRG